MFKARWQSVWASPDRCRLLSLDARPHPHWSWQVRAEHAAARAEEIACEADRLAAEAAAAKGMT